MITITLASLAIFLVCLLIRDNMISTYKISYYEEKLKTRGVDISHIQNIKLREILKK